MVQLDSVCKNFFLTIWQMSVDASQMPAIIQCYFSSCSLLQSYLYWSICILCDFFPFFSSYQMHTLRPKGNNKTSECLINRRVHSQTITRNVFFWHFDNCQFFFNQNHCVNTLKANTHWRKPMKCDVLLIFHFDLVISC